MLTEARSQFRVMRLSVKYALMREMLNKVSFFSNVIFMMLNNASFIIQWLVIYSIKDNIVGYNIKDIILLWGMASVTYGVARFFFKNAFNLSNTITNGKLDAFLVQPKDILLSCITTDVEVSALGDILYGYIMLFIYGVTLKNFFIFTVCAVCGGLLLVSISVIFSSLSFWFVKADMVSDTANALMVNFATYPDGIFKGIAKIILYTIVPVGISTYLPVSIIREFNIFYFVIIIAVCVIMVSIAYLVFYSGLRRYSSSNLMIARI